ncbi:unnamed protein product [Somion occarium]|uniref:2'-phosphotransferase n=1 Tax=Somion occarium TaxID=3059160 RepID=A0ABP1E5E1_9APHY
MSSEQNAESPANNGPKTTLEEKDGRKPRTKGGRQQGGSSKLRGLPRDPDEVRMSKTLSWVLRHGAKSEGLFMRPDGYVRVHDLLSLPKFQGMDFEKIQKIVEADAKQRYGLLFQSDPSSQDATEIWWIRASQGHSLNDVELDLKPINSVDDIPTRTAVHGTNRKAWETIRTKGLSKMRRNHIHLAQGVPGSGVISGMRQSAQILIHVDVQAAIDAGLKFFMSDNGVILTSGNERGILEPRFFEKVEQRQGKVMQTIPLGPATAKGPSTTVKSTEGTSENSNSQATTEVSEQGAEQAKSA